MSNPNILFVAPRFHTNQFFLTKNLIEKGIKVKFLSIYTGGSENYTFIKPTKSKPSRIVQWCLGKRDARYAKDRSTLRKFHITSFRQIRALYREFDPDIIIIRNLRPLISIQHILYSLVLGRDVILYTQNNYYQRIGFIRKLFYTAIGLLGIKHYTPVQGDKSLPPLPNSVYVPIVFEPLVTENSIKSKLSKNGISILTIGKMVERKNLIQLVDSLFRINFFNTPSNKLIIVAECLTQNNFNYLENIKRSITSHHTQIEFHLNVAHSEVFKLLQSADLFVMPSQNEPFGISLVEAMACGLPVICSNSNGSQWYVKEGTNGYVFRTSPNFVDLDNTISKILDKEKLVIFGKASLNVIKLNHNINNFYDSLIRPIH